MKVRTLASLLFVFLMSAGLCAQSRDTILLQIGETSDWTLAGKVRQIDDKSLSGFAGKSAGAMRALGLNGISIQDWNGAAGRVRLTLYEMRDSSGAYGLFTLQRDLEKADSGTLPYGTEGFRSGSRVFFWQAKYVVRMDGADKASDTLGQAVSERIFGRSKKPPVAELLPPKNLIPGTERYIMDPVALDPSLGLGGAELGFEDDLEVATGRYEISGQTVSLVLLMYPTQQVARKHAEALDQASPADQQSRKRAGPLVAWVRGVRDPAVAEEILNAVAHESKVTWTQPRQDLSLPEVILTIFSFIGIALAFTFVAGISFGGARVFVKARFPNLIFDRAEDVELIQLKLNQGLTRDELES